MWKYRGQERPPFALTPGDGQESVWDYPRPPRIARDSRLVEIRFGDRLIASSTRAIRILETASPPTFYVPRDDVVIEALAVAAGSSVCEWKGAARFWTLAGHSSAGPVAWDYPEPTAAYGEIRDHMSFYPAKVECYVDGEGVRPQPGGFYGGWMTDEIVGPVKGEPGTGHW